MHLDWRFAVSSQVGRGSDEAERDKKDNGGRKGLFAQCVGKFANQ